MLAALQISTRRAPGRDPRRDRRAQPDKALRMTTRCSRLSLAVLALWPCLAAADAPKKVVLIAGELDAGHPRGTHEYEKSVRLLEHCLKTSPNLKGVKAESHFRG